MNDFLPVSRKDMQRRGWRKLDVILITGDAMGRPLIEYLEQHPVAEAHGHHHHHGELSGGRLGIAVLLNVGITVAQVVGGLVSGWGSPGHGLG